VEDRPGEQWVRLRSRAARPGAEADEEVKVEATLFDGAAEPLPEDAPLFSRVESLERGPRLHLSLIVEVTRADRVLGFVCSAWPDELAVRHVLSLRAGSGAGSSDGARGGRNFEYGFGLLCCAVSFLVSNLVLCYLMFVLFASQEAGC
jgi:hypothetical protein